VYISHSRGAQRRIPLHWRQHYRNRLYICPSGTADMSIFWISRIAGYFGVGRFAIVVAHSLNHSLPLWSFPCPGCDVSQYLFEQPAWGPAPFTPSSILMLSLVLFAFVVLLLYNGQYKRLECELTDPLVRHDAQADSVHVGKLLSLVSCVMKRKYALRQLAVW
jgi:hypothetical protein